MARPDAAVVARVAALHDDPEQCALAVGLRYVDPSEPGIRRVRCGGGFSYRNATGARVEPGERARIEGLVIPPAWREVWICADSDGHLLALGYDERGRAQYLYHERWRAFRDRLNFHRLVRFGDRLPSIRAEVEAQLRRRTLDRDRVIAAMVRIVDRCALRIGSEEYAHDNDSYGLTTLTRRHVQVRRDEIVFDFPAKSGRRVRRTLTDRGVARVVEPLLEGAGRRVFRVDGRPIDAAQLNARLAEVAGPAVTAKDFRTWHGTRLAFEVLRARSGRAGDPAQDVLDAVDAAAELLGNTRAVARAHYVHPQLIESYSDGRFADDVARRRPSRRSGLDPTERRLLPLLHTLLDRDLGKGQGSAWPAT